ncbi:MAG: hypothetical protein WDN04_11415 [Rhodospirillales bacterium]
MDPFLPAWRLAELTTSGQIGCLELLDTYIDRVERLDIRLNAVVVRDFERARARAGGWTMAGAPRRGRCSACR